ncbi:MAG: hypothetical protein AAFZ65_10020 [Planctomycetota bacterium]
MLDDSSRSDTWAPGWARVAALALGSLALTPAASAQASYFEDGKVVLEVIYDGTLAPSDPDYEEALAYIRYPVGTGPLSLGYPQAPLPAFLTSRGGNQNAQQLGQPGKSDITDLVNDSGLVDLVYNYPEVGPDEDYRVAAEGIARLIQYLRANALDLNLRPDAIVLQGRSFGTMTNNSVAFTHDRADPASGDPVLMQSSRPDYYIPRFGPSTLTCFTDQLGPWVSGLNAMYFPGKTFFEATEEERLEESAVWWLRNPKAYGRDRTPPIFVVYGSDHGDVCGAIDDVHSGLFGELLLEAIDDHARATGRYDWLAKCGAYSNENIANPNTAILTWTIGRMAADVGNGLWMTQPVGVPGESATLTVADGIPGNTVSFFSGTVPQKFPLPGCPGLEGELMDFVELGSSEVNSVGAASFTFPVTADSAGATVRYHAVDLTACETSNVVTHAW